MEKADAEAALALPPAAILDGVGPLFDVAARIMELGGPGVVTAIVTAIPGMARAPPETWNFAWYYATQVKYKEYEAEWVVAFWHVHQHARHIPDFWRRAYVCCSMLVRVSCVAVHELLLRPEPLFQLWSNSNFIKTVARLVDPSDAQDSLVAIDRVDAVFPERGLSDFALLPVHEIPPEDQIEFVRMEERHVTRPLVLSAPSLHALVQLRGDDVSDPLPMELRQDPVHFDPKHPPPLTITAIPRGRFRTLLDVVARPGAIARAAYNFNGVFFVARYTTGVEMRQPAPGAPVTLRASHSFRLMGFNAAGVLQLWLTHVERRAPGPDAWLRYSEAASSPSSAVVARFLEDQSDARFSLGHLVRFGAGLLDRVTLSLLVGDADRRPAWMEALGLAVKKNSSASVILSSC